MRGTPRILAGLLLTCVCAIAHAQQRDAAAREAFAAGRAAYEQKRFDEALEQFKRCYVLGGRPELLYNIASTLQNLNRPGEAADTLREFLKLGSGPADRADLEERIAALDRAQQLIDRDKQRTQRELDERMARKQRELELQRAAQSSGAGYVTEREAELRVEHVRDKERRRKRALGLGLGLGLGALVIGGVVVGIVCGVGRCSAAAAQDHDFDRLTVTR